MPAVAAVWCVRGDIVDSRENEPANAPEPIGADLIIPVLACILAIYYLSTTTDLVWEARAAGVFIGVPLIAMCLVHAARMGVRVARGTATLGTGDLFANTFFNRQRIGLAVLVAGFVACIEWTGTTLGIFVLLIASMLLLGVRSIAILLGISLTTSALVYGLLITLMGSRLPQGPAEWLLNPVIAKIVGLVTGGS
jgi:hypothetical protein